jgi:alpha-1,3-rhamnosyl/mannosyltransferase
MNIVIDVSHMHPANKHRGVGLYTHFLFDHLQQLTSSHTFSLKTEPTQPFAADLIHFPFFDFFFATLPFSTNSPSLVTIHDCIPLLYPAHYKPGIKGKFNYIKQRISLKNVDHVITNSLTSKHDISRFLGVPNNKISPIPMAGNPALIKQTLVKRPKSLASLNIHKPFFLYVGDINYNKNITFLLKSFAPLKKRAHLVLVSKALAHDIPESREIKQTIHALGLENDVVLATAIPNEPIDALQWLYQNAQAYVQPSLYEGFGIPVVEALSSGTLVICSMGGSLKEFKHEAIFPIDPTQAQSLTIAFQKVLELPTKDKSALEAKAVVYASNYSWKKCAQNTLAVYEQVAHL